MRILKQNVIVMCLFASNSILSQNSKIKYSVSLPIQLDFQTAEITYGRYEIQKNTAINFGINGTANIKLTKKLFAIIGVGYLRHRFAIVRPYDHRLLNPVVDSLPILTKTTSYEYHLLQFPLGIQYHFSTRQNALGIAVVYTPGIAISSTYNGASAVPNANHTRSGLQLFSQSIALLFEIPIICKSNYRLSIEPYTRIDHLYKKDIYLYETESEIIRRNFDAIGFAVKYSFHFHH